MSIKVYLQYDGEPVEGISIVSERLGREALKLKLTLPASWVGGPTSKLLTFFVDSYNKKFADKKLDAEELHLQVAGIDLAPEQIVSSCINDYNDVLILHKRAVASAAKRPEGSVACTNYGCGKHYVPISEEDAAPTACSHHTKPPVFHDTFKYWGCCPDKKAADWEDFERIPPCEVGPHCCVPKPAMKLDQTIASTALTQDQLAAMPNSAAGAEAAGGERRSGPREFEEAVNAQNDKPGPVDAEGFANCRNFGCQKRFNVNDNTETSCTYHSGGPVFWDTYKYWKCCPEKKAYEFDDFVKIAGCCTGKHKQ